MNRSLISSYAGTMAKAEPAQSMEEILKTLNETIAQQQAQINQLLAASKTKVEPAAAVTPEAIVAPKSESNPAEVTEVGENKRKKTGAANEPAKKLKRDITSLYLHWDKIMIKVDEGKEEDKEWWIDEAMAEKIRLLREDALYKAKVIFAGIFKGPTPLLLKKKNFTLTCSKVKSDELETFHSVDMVAPELRDYNKQARDSPLEALNNLKGDSLLVDRFAEMITLAGINRAEFVCCSTKKGFISFYAPVQTETGSPHLTLQHHITLELKHLMDDVSGARLRLLRGMLEEATDPSVKAVNLLENFKYENRGAAVTCKVYHLNPTDKDNTWGLRFFAMDTAFNKDSKSFFAQNRFNDSIEVYKAKVEAPAKADEIVEVVPDAEAKVDLVVLDDQDEVVAVETVDEMNNSFIPINV